MPLGIDGNPELVALIVMHSISNTPIARVLRASLSILFLFATHAVHAEPWTYGSGDQCIGEVSADTPDEAFDQLAAKVHACYPETTWVRRGACTYRSSPQPYWYGGAADCFYDNIQSWGTLYNQNQPIGKICGRVGSQLGDPAYPYYDDILHDCACRPGMAREDDNFCHGIKYFLSALAPDNSQCDATCNVVGDPINPGAGEVIDSLSDLSSSNLELSRTYASSDRGAKALAPGWRHVFSRSITPVFQAFRYRSYTQAQAYNSSRYADPSTACLNGFGEIKAHVGTWANASSTYENGMCSVIVSGMAIATLPIYSPQHIPPSTSLTAIDATREGGRVVRFTVQGGVFAASPGSVLRLTSVSDGYQLADGNDSVELYGLSGKLQSIATRNGVVHTLSYDTAGQLHQVVDSFGHRITLTYDSNNRVSNVTSE